MNLKNKRNKNNLYYILLYFILPFGDYDFLLIIAIPYIYIYVYILHRLFVFTPESVQRAEKYISTSTIVKVAIRSKVHYSEFILIKQCTFLVSLT